jgi:hypothetical protein
VTSVVRRRTALALRAAALCLVASLPLVAQDADKFEKLDAASRFAIEQVLDSANVLGLPSFFLRSTALEGIARKADGRKIVNAVREDLGYLKTARASLGTPATDEELIAGAAVLRAGAKPAQLAPFKARQKQRSDVQAFTIWADLMTRGVPGEDASSAITKLWQDGADDDTFSGLWNAVQSDIIKGLNPGAALQNRIRETPGRPTANKVTPPEGPQENQSSR